MLKKFLKSCCVFCIGICVAVAVFASTKDLTDQDQVISGINSFAFSAFKKLYKEDNGKNVTISPLSISTALAMVYNGALAGTKQEISKVFGLDKVSLEKINQTYADLAAHNRDLKPYVQLESANSMWVANHLQIISKFAQDNRKYFDAKINNVDFSNPSVAAKINQWVKNNTHGKIEKIIETVNREMSLILINAIYFKGKWDKPFDPKNTKDQVFHAQNNKGEKIPFMTQHGHFNYSESDMFQAIMLPYGKERKVNMYVFLPKTNTSINAFVAKLNANNWNKWLSNFQSHEGSVSLPKYKVEYSTSLSASLKSLGMPSAFNSDKANFGGIATNNLFISDVIHKTFIDVNEEGTEAAAVTAVVMMEAMASPVVPFKFVANRPFFYAIVDGETNAILFMGVLGGLLKRAVWYKTCWKNLLYY